MDLTKLEHYLIIGGVRTAIDEPVGFDGLKTTIKRGDYHGVSAEVSIGTLEFYNTPNHRAADMIRAAYNSDIDTEVGYLVTDKDGVEVYSGVVDLATYSEKSGNSTKISCKVGEVGIKTTFNNRTETEVDMNRTTTIDGAAIKTGITPLRLRIPARSVVYTNLMQARETVVWDKDNAAQGEDFHLADDVSHQWINIPITGMPIFHEFGEQMLQPYAVYGSADTKPSDPRVGDNVICDFGNLLFDKGSSFDEKFGSDSKYDIEMDVTVTVELGSPLFTNSPTGGIQEMTADFVLVDETMTMADPVLLQTYVANAGQQTYTNDALSKTFNIKTTLTGRTEQKLALGLSMRNRNFYEDNIGVHRYFNNPSSIKVTVKEGSYIRMTLMSKTTTKDIYAETILVHNALNHIVECISENQLQCKSNFYKTPNSYDASGGVSCGNGGLKAITNGYKIRGLCSDGETERNMPLSFKDMVEAMDTQDCIGWGFVEENGKLVVRVEQWRWFYKDNVILTINNPKEKTLAIDTDWLITSLKIGYKKYTTNEDINAIDSIHSERTFTSQIKSVSNTKEKLCKFIADNFAIEETRRKAMDADTEEFKYDENIFIFELNCGNGGGSRFSYVICTNRANNVFNVSNPQESYNMALSPRRMAENWAWRMATFNSDSPLEMTKGTVNYKAAFGIRQNSTISPPYYTYYYPTPTKVIAEDDPIVNSKPLFRAETLKIEYPLTISQYQAVKRNPYGLIIVDGAKYWLKEMRFEFKTGKAELTLIPKNE
jgi:hypothetical protein